MDRRGGLPISQVSNHDRPYVLYPSVALSYTRMWLALDIHMVSVEIRLKY